MSSFYVVKTINRLCFLYRAGNGDLIFRFMENGRLSPEACLLADARRYFSVTLNRDAIHVFSQDEAGHLWLMTERAGHWSNRAINTGNDNSDSPSTDWPESVEDGLTSSSHDVLITPQLTGKGMCILYNTLSGDGTGHFLVRQAMGENGEWLPAQRIDKFHPLVHALYETQSTSDEHLLLFYQTRATENQLGYREITPTLTGPYHRFHNGPGTVTDTAFLTTDNTVHVLYVIRTLFSCQLLYRRKTDKVFETPILLWESPRIDQCLLSIVHDNLYATCVTGGQLYMAISENKGASFSRMTLYKSKFCYEPVRAVYLSSLPMTENGLYIRHAYVDRHTPWDVQMLPDLYSDFFTFPKPPEPVAVAEQDEMLDMRERLAEAQRQLDERERHIMQLMLEKKVKQ